MKKFLQSTEECLKRFVEASNINEVVQTRCDVRRNVCTILDISSDSGYRWFNNLTLPFGENLVKLRFFLDLMGFHPAEWHGMPDLNRQMAAQIVLKVTSVAQVGKRLDTSSHQVFRYLTRGTGFHPDRAVIVQNMVEEHQSLAAKNLNLLLAEIEKSGLVVADAAKPFAGVQLPVAASNDCKAKTIEALAHLILAAHPLAERMVSVSYGKEDRDLLRVMTNTKDHKALFELSTFLNRLCTETAFKRFG